MRITRQYLLLCIAQDIAGDIRLSRRRISSGYNAEQERSYEALCVTQLRALYRNRRTVKINDYGWPMLPEFNRAVRCAPNPASKAAT